MKKTISTLFLFQFLPATIYAADFSDLYFFNEEMRNIVMQTPGGNPLSEGKFHLTKSEADQVSALSNNDNLIRNYLESDTNKDCDQVANKSKDALARKVSKRDTQISLMIKTSNETFEQEAVGRFMSDDYISYMGKMINSGNYKGIDIYSIAELKNKFAAKYSNEDLSRMSFNDRVSKLERFANDYIGDKLPTGLLMKEMAFQEMVSNSKNWKDVLNVAKDKLSNQQKIELVSKVGGFFGNHYNYDRFNEGMSAKGYVTIEKLFDSLKDGTSGGICRDIALAQTQILRELGFKNNYTITYKTLGGFHTDVITTDPETGKIIKFNYSETSAHNKGSGTTVLNQDNTLADHGINYRIHDADGKSVTQVSSELGNILKEATGGDVNKTFLDKSYSLAKAQFKLGNTDGNLFYGKTSLGENIYGVALNQKYESEFLTLNGGVAISKLEGNRTFMAVDQQNLYGRLAAEVRSPSVVFKKTSVQGFASVEGEGIAYQATEKSNSSNYTKKTDTIQLDGKAEMKIGVKATTQLSDDLTMTNKAYVTYYPDIKHVADAQSVGVTKDSVVIQSGISKKISADQALLIDTTIMLKNYGTSAAITAAYENSKTNTKFAATYVSPISGSVPSFLPGGSRRLIISAEKETKKDLYFGLEFDHNFTTGVKSYYVRGTYKFN